MDSLQCNTIFNLTFFGQDDCRDITTSQNLKRHWHRVPDVLQHSAFIDDEEGLVEDNILLVEVKTGYTGNIYCLEDGDCSGTADYAAARAKAQADIDRHLLDTGQVDSVEWDFYPNTAGHGTGPGAELVRYLVYLGFDVVIHNCADPDLSNCTTTSH